MQTSSQTAMQARHLADEAASQADEASEVAGIALARARQAAIWATVTAEAADEADRHNPAA